MLPSNQHYIRIIYKDEENKFSRVSLISNDIVLLFDNSLDLFQKSIDFDLKFTYSLECFLLELLVINEVLDCNSKFLPLKFELKNKMQLLTQYLKKNLIMFFKRTFNVPLSFDQETFVTISAEDILRTIALKQINLYKTQKINPVSKFANNRPRNRFLNKKVNNDYYEVLTEHLPSPIGHTILAFASIKNNTSLDTVIQALEIDS